MSLALTLARPLSALLKRAYTVGPYTWNAYPPWMQNRQANEVPVTMESAFTYAAVYDAVNVGASDVAKLPLSLLKRRPTGGSDPFTDSRLYRLLKYEPNPEMGSMNFRRTLTAHAMTSHGGYAEIERDRVGKPIALWPLTPDRVEPIRRRRRSVDEGGGYEVGPLQYRLDGRDDTILDAADVLHIQGLGYDGVCGYEVIQKARRAIALGLAAEQFGSAFFGTGASFGGILMSEEAPPDEESEKALRATIAAYQTDAGRTQRFLTLFGQGWKFERTGVNPQDSQMDELRDKQVEEVARFFNMPLHKLKLNKPGAVSYASVEMADLDYYKGFLLNWITLWEEELNRKLISPLERNQQFIKHNVNAFLRGDIKSRYEALGIARNHGIINANEWRDLEDMNPQDGDQGNIYFIQGAMVPTNRVNDLVDATIKKDEAKAEPPTPPASPGQREIDLANERADKAEQLVHESEQRIVTLQEQVTAVLTNDATNTERIAQLRAAIEREQAHVMTFTELAETRRHEISELQRAKDAVDEELRKTAEAKGKAKLAETRRKEVADLQIAKDALAEELRKAGEANGKAEAEIEHARERAYSAEAHKLAAETAAEEARQRELEAIAAKDAADFHAREAEITAENAVTDRDAAVAAQQQATEAADEARNHVAAAIKAREDAETAAASAQCIAEATKADADKLVAELRAQYQQEADLRAAAEVNLAKAQDLAARECETIHKLTSERDFATIAVSETTKEVQSVANERVQLQQQIELLQAAQAGSAAELEALKTNLAAMEQEKQAARDMAASFEARALQIEAEAAAQRTAEMERISALIPAHRGIILDVMQRIVARQVTFAKRNRATPDKMRKWLSTMDVFETEVCMEALLPFMKAHADMVCGGDHAIATDALIKDHLAEFHRQLDAALESDDYHGNLERVLARWETERPSRVADDVMAEQIAYLRTIASRSVR